MDGTRQARVSGSPGRAKVALGSRRGTGRGLRLPRPGPHTIQELSICDIDELPAGKSLERPLRPVWKIRMKPSPPAPRATPQSSPRKAQVSFEDVSSPSPPLPPRRIQSIRKRQKPSTTAPRATPPSSPRKAQVKFEDVSSPSPPQGLGRPMHSIRKLQRKPSTPATPQSSPRKARVSFEDVSSLSPPLPPPQGLERPLHPIRKRQRKPSTPATPQSSPRKAQASVDHIPSHSPAPQGLERPMHSIRTLQRQPSTPAPQATLPSPPQRAQVSFEDVSSPSSPLPPLEACVVSGEPASSIESSGQSLQDQGIGHDFFYGSEPESDESDDDGVALMARWQRSLWETPLFLDDAADQPAADAPSPTPAAAPEDSSTNSNLDVPPSATDKPWGLYQFDWKPFPDVPIPPESRREKFSHNNAGPTTPLVDPYEIFLSIWDRQFMEYIATETNRYAQQVAARLLDTNSLHPNSRIRNWHDTNADELYIYFGLLIAMGVVVKTHLNTYWSSTPDVFYTPGFGAHMSCHRFMILSKCLHFVDNETMCAQELDASEAKLYKVQPLLSHLNNKFETMYCLDQNIALDESLLQWKGWLDINQIIPNKSATVGIKTYEICESQTGYLWRFEVHTMRKSQPQQFEDPMKATTPAIVLRLIRGLEGKGHTLWMDNYYNSPCLARHLKLLGIDCVGTLRTNREGVPQALHNLSKENMRQGQITGLTSGDVDVMVWRDNSRVGMISTYHGNAVCRIRETTKPILIHDYNIMMGGVDKKDQMLAMYPMERKRTKVWYKKLFRRFLNVSVLNAHIIHRKSVSASSVAPLTHRNFRIRLVKSLLTKHYCVSFPPAPHSLHQNNLYDARSHRLAEYPFGASHQRRRRKCANYACGKLVQTYCVGCSKTMCIDTCFLALHS